MKHRLGLIWFQNDLRSSDQRVLTQAAQECEQLICLFCVNPKWFEPNRYGLTSIGAARWQFLQQSLADLEQQLHKLGNQLLVRVQTPLHAMAELIGQYGVDAIYRSRQHGYYENQYWSILQQRYPFLHYHEEDSSTLFDLAQLPFALDELPDTFSKFRRKVEKPNLREAIRPVLPAPTQLPPAPFSQQARSQLPDLPHHEQVLLHGGSSAAKAHLQQYFNGRFASDYKQTRNSLDGFSDSTKFSAWLADGSISAREVVAYLDAYEQRYGANESTYWIYFELLWREYFIWYAARHQQRLFHFRGIKDKRPQTSFYGHRFQQWCQGETPFPIVNACMKQLNATGYMSNRGRQLVASCFVHELGLDWRYGAAYFERQLIDYDVGANWGNWQYLAGVGADPRGHRRFDLAKQTRMYDPQGEFIASWQGEHPNAMLDVVDAADWPLSP